MTQLVFGYTIIILFSKLLDIETIWRTRLRMFLTLSQTSHVFLKTLWEKEKLLVTSNFSFSHSVLYPFGKLSIIVVKFEIVVCKSFQFGKVLNLSFGNGLIMVGEYGPRSVLQNLNCCRTLQISHADIPLGVRITSTG